jgi:hypothetical protein
VFLNRLSAGGTCRGWPRAKTYVASRGRGSISYFCGCRPALKAEISYFRRSKASSSLIPFFISAMGQQVTKDIRSQLERCTLQELLTNDQVIPYSSLGEFHRLTAYSLLRSFSSISQGCPRDPIITLQKF